MNTAHSLDNKKKGVGTVGEVATLFVLLVVFLFRFQFDGNEIDVLPYARAFYKPDWLTADWYLHLHIPYRFLFSYSVGWSIDTFGLVPALVSGRLISYFLFSWALVQLKRATLRDLPFAVFLIPFSVYLLLFQHGFGAKEWMVGALDTKVFAYAFVLLSVACAIQKKHVSSLAFAGAALSFHLLIGAYSAFCLLPVFGVQLYRGETPMKTWVKGTIAFLIAGAVGLYGIVYQLFMVPAHQADKAWETYVQFRVPHHLVPSEFPTTWWVFLCFFTLLNSVIWRFASKSNLRQLALYCLMMSLLCAVGIAIYFWGPVSALRYYFFRLADGFLPLATLIGGVGLVFEKRPQWKNYMRGRGKLVVLLLVIGVSISPTYKLFSTATLSSKTFTSNHPQDWEMVEFVRARTSENNVFCVWPINYYWYVDYERPVFVSYKHAPQNPTDLSEWKKRLILLNHGNELRRDGQFRANFTALNEEDFLNIKKLYPEVTHALLPAEMKLDFPVLHETEEHVLYALPIHKNE